MSKLTILFFSVREGLPCLEHEVLWLEKPIPDAAVRERYGVFCYNNPARKSAYSGRVMLPVKDVAEVLYGYLGRAIEPTPW